MMEARKPAVKPKTQPKATKAPVTKQVIQPKVVVQPKEILDEDPLIKKYRALVALHDEVESDTAAVTLICEFHPHELNVKKAEDLHTLAAKFEQHISVIQQIVTALNNKNPQTRYDQLKAIELQKLSATFAGFSNWMNDKYNEYTKLLTLHMEAFKKIYTALYEGESGTFKHNFMAGRSWYTPLQLLADIRKDDSERTKMSYQLAEKYLHKCSWDNDELFMQIYKYSFKHSGFFSRSRLMGITIFRSSVLFEYSAIKALEEHIHANPHSRTARICNALGYKLNKEKVPKPEDKIISIKNR